MLSRRAKIFVLQLCNCTMAGVLEEQEQLAEAVRGLLREVQEAVASAPGQEASIRDWVLRKRACAGWETVGGVLFTEWLCVQEVAEAFGDFGGGKEEILFLADHVDGE